MFYLDGVLLSKYCYFLNSTLSKQRLSQIVQLDLRNFLFQFSRQTLHLSLSPDFPIVYLGEEKPGQKVESPFLLSLKKHLQSAILNEITQPHYERVLQFHFSKLTVIGEVENFTLTLEMIPRAPNLILTNSQQNIVALFKSHSLDRFPKRPLLVHFPYSLPTQTQKQDPFSISADQFKQFDTPSQRLENIAGIGKKCAEYITSFKIFQHYLHAPLEGFIAQESTLISLFSFSQGKSIPIEHFFQTYFSTQKNSDHFLTLKRSLIKIITKYQEKQRETLHAIQLDQERVSTYETEKQYGDILAANHSQLTSRLTQITLFNFYTNQECIIALDPLLSAEKNIQRYYQQYQKKKRSLEHLKERFQHIQHNISHSETILFSLEIASSLPELKEIEQELVQLKLITSITRVNRPTKKKAPAFLTIPYQEFILYIGKNNLSNEWITFSLAKRNDLWFHVQGIPSAHVILTSPEQKPITQEAIHFAALQCKQYSKAQNSLNVPVDYTEKKNLHKQQPYKPCLVYYHSFKTITV